MIAFSGVRSSWISWRSESAGNCGAEHAGRRVGGAARSRRAAAAARCRDSPGSCRGADRRRARPKSASRPRPGRSPATLKRASRNGARFSKAPAAWPSTPCWPGPAIAAMLCPTRAPARRALDPEHDAVGAGLPAEALGRGRRLRPARAAARSPRCLRKASIRSTSSRICDSLCSRRGMRRRRGRLGRHARFEHEIARPEGAQRMLHLGVEILAVAEQGARGRAEPGQQRQPVLAAEPAPGDQRRRDRRAVLGEESEQIGRDRPPGERAGRLPADRRDRPRRVAREAAHRPAATSASLGVPAGAGRAGRRAGATARPRRSGRSAGCASTVAIMSSKRIAARVTGAGTAEEAPNSPRRNSGRRAGADERLHRRSAPATARAARAGRARRAGR